MADYRKMYLTLFNAITDAVTALQRIQQEAEELYIIAKEPNITVLERLDTGTNDNSEDET